MNDSGVKTGVVDSPESARIKSLERELHEYIRVEAVLVECGAVSKDRLQQCHDMVRDLRDMKL